MIGATLVSGWFPQEPHFRLKGVATKASSCAPLVEIGLVSTSRHHRIPPLPEVSRL